jgi:hypothetical protein
MKRQNRDILGVIAWIISTLIGLAFAIIVIKLLFFS